MTDKQLLAGCTILYVHDKKNGFNYYMLEKDGYSYRIDEKKLSGNLASLVKKYDLAVLELTPKELTTRVNNQQKKGYNYFDKDDRVLGLSLLSKGQGVMDEIQESGVWDSMWMLGLSTAAIRSTQTFSNETGGTGNVLKGSKNGQVYTLDWNKSAGTVSYKKASGSNQKVISELESPVLDGRRVESGAKVDDVKPVWGKDPKGRPVIEKEFPQVAKEHGFPDIIDNYPTSVNEYPLVGGDGIDRIFFQFEGSNNGKNGVYEWIVEPNGDVSHRRFIDGGVLTGKPNQIPKKRRE